MKKITGEILEDHGFIHDSSGDYDIEIEDVGRLTISSKGRLAIITDDIDPAACICCTSYPVVSLMQLKRLYRALSGKELTKK